MQSYQLRTGSPAVESEAVAMTASFGVTTKAAVTG